jgi:CheY-like chemotaxis protein
MERSYTILYVDDDIDDLHLITEAFEKYTDHLTVIHAYNGFEGLMALDRMRKEEALPCLLIIDINMPVMDGKQMLKKLREGSVYQDLPVILFSTSKSQTDGAFAEKYDAEFISKPGKYTELKDLVEQFVNRCRIEVKNSA